MHELKELGGKPLLSMQQGLVPDRRGKKEGWKALIFQSGCVFLTAVLGCQSSLYVFEFWDLHQWLSLGSENFGFPGSEVSYSS